MVASLQEAAGQREKLLSELSAQLEEAQQKQVALLQEKDEAQEENAALLQNYTRLQASVSELQARVQEQEERTALKAQLEHEIQELKTNLAGKQKSGMLKANTEYCNNFLNPDSNKSLKLLCSSVRDRSEEADRIVCSRFEHKSVIAYYL